MGPRGEAEAWKGAAPVIERERGDTDTGRLSLIPHPHPHALDTLLSADSTMVSVACALCTAASGHSLRPPSVVSFELTVVYCPPASITSPPGRQHASAPSSSPRLAPWTSKRRGRSHHCRIGHGVADTTVWLFNNSAGIQTLLDAEKEAAKIVQKARECEFGLLNPSPIAVTSSRLVFEHPWSTPRPGMDVERAGLTGDGLREMND